MTLRTVFMITGIGVHDPPESVFTIEWNLCSRSNGIRVHDPPERAFRPNVSFVPHAETRNSSTASHRPPFEVVARVVRDRREVGVLSDHLNLLQTKAPLVLIPGLCDLLFRSAAQAIPGAQKVSSLPGYRCVGMERNRP